MRIFLTDDPAATEALKGAKQAVYSLTAEPMPDLRSGEVILVGKAGQVKTSALGFAARGVSQSRISYVEISPGDDILAKARKPKHLHWDDVGPLSEAPDDDEFKVYPSGFAFLDKLLGWGWRLPELCICAGPYGSGKSMLAQLLAIRFANGAGRELGSGALLCSWEDMPAEIKRNVGRHAESNHADANDLLGRIHYVRRHPDEDRLISWFMNLVEYHHARYGTRFFVLDPWNEVDHVKDARQSETDYIRDMMKAFRRLVDKLKIILIIVTHVAAKVIKGDGSVEPFKLAHAFGSVQFANKADRGICVLRTRALLDKRHDHMIIRHDKSKIERKMGIKGTIAAKYLPASHDLTLDTAATAEVKEIWKG